MQLGTAVMCIVIVFFSAIFFSFTLLESTSWGVSNSNTKNFTCPPDVLNLITSHSNITAIMPVNNLTSTSIVGLLSLEEINNYNDTINEPTFVLWGISSNVTIAGTNSTDGRIVGVVSKVNYDTEMNQFVVLANISSASFYTTETGNGNFRVGLIANSENNASLTFPLHSGITNDTTKSIVAHLIKKIVHVDCRKGGTVVIVPFIDFETGRQEYLSAWNQSDFHSEFETFVSDAGDHGIFYGHLYKNIFTPGENIVLYIEPLGFGHKPVLDDKGNTLYQMNFTAIISITDKAGLKEIQRTEYNDNTVIPLVNSYNKNTEWYLKIPITQSLPFPEGEYKIKYNIRDGVLGKSFEVVKNIRIMAQIPDLEDIINNNNLTDTFIARLTDHSKIPAAETTSVNDIVLEPKKEGIDLQYRLNNIDLNSVTAAHIHTGLAEDEGPVIVTLLNKSSGPTELLRKITLGNFEGPLANAEELSDLITLLNHTNSTYIDIHTSEFSNGEIRGQAFNATTLFPVDNMQAASQELANLTSVNLLKGTKKQYLSAWNQTDFHSEFDTFIEPGTAQGYGIYKPHESNVFPQGETIELYLEPVGFTQYPFMRKNGEKLYATNLTADIIITDKEGKLRDTFDADFWASHNKNLETFTTIRIAQSKSTPFPEGEYSIRYIVTDGVSGDSFELVKNIVIIGATVPSLSDSRNM